MASKRCYNLQDGETDGEPESNRSRSGELRNLINHQLTMINPNILNRTETLQNLISNQHEWLQLTTQNNNNNDQVGGVIPSARESLMPNINLNQDEIRRLATEGGTFGEFTVVARPRFNGLEIHRTLNPGDIATTDLAAYNILLNTILDEIVTFSRLMAGDTGYINISLTGANLPTAINAVLTPENNHNADLFIDQIERAAQSNKEVSNDTQMNFRISIAMDRSGGARRKITDLAITETIRKNKMNLFCPINVEDNMCFSYCLAHFLNPKAPDDELKKIAEEIHTRAGYTTQTKIGFHDISIFERFLDLKIVVFHRDCSGKLLVYKNSDELHPKTVHLFIHESHYYLIKNLKAFIGNNFVCEFCYKGFNDIRLHKCKYACDICLDSECHTHTKKTSRCNDCNRICRSAYCYAKHKQSRVPGERPQCDVVKYCDKCCVNYRMTGGGNKNKKKHKCAPKRCIHCDAVLAPEGIHNCYIQPVKPDETDEKYVYYDFETMYEGGKHVPNYVCAITHDGKEFTAAGTTCVESMIKHFRRKKYSNYTFLAHNASGFDSHILLEYFVSEGIAPKIIMQGCRIIYMYDTAFKQRYIDTLSYMAMSLSKIPAALNLPVRDKGFFPHLFNRIENADYVGPYPSKELYGYDKMSTADRSKFDTWYTCVQGGVFDLKKELAFYCRNDVIILREACISYRAEFVECSKIDPFKCITLAGTCMKVFKANFLSRDTLALTHNNAYVNQFKTYSNTSIQWLEYIKETKNVDVHHALNYGEVKFGPYHVDGYYEKSSGEKIALEFLGCFYHGHDCRFNPNDLNPLSNVPFGVLRRQSDNKLQVLRDVYSLRVISLWECEWERLKQRDPGVMAFMASYTTPERLRPRDALFGGRTNAIKLYHKITEEERIDYFDFCSLYPYVQSHKTYPTGHPRIIFKDFEPVENYFGLIKAEVLPPRKLFHPVLPYRCAKKLMFPLCRTCAEGEIQTIPCNHTDEQRILRGCWVSVELARAIKHGYVVVKIDEVWHFSQTSDSLFSGYVKTFLKVKQEASGFPSHVVTDDDKQTYIKNYLDKEGITLDIEKIAHNPAKRTITKYMLNSLWGRFALRPNQPSTELLTEPEEFAQYIFGTGRVINHFSFVSDKVALIQWSYAGQDECLTRDVNVFIGAFTTAYARLELYELLDKLGERVVYTDTDSVIFISKNGDWVPECGPYLGDLTSELEPNDLIQEFCSSGPKSYGYRTAKGHVCLKAKGITLTAENSQIVSLQSLIGLVRGFVESRDTSHLLAQTDAIVRDKRRFTLHNRTIVKSFRVVYNKRVLLSDYTTIPYGF
ncbi:uncharacterized protein [Pseudorasbora parva]|uniref:uncharacterized protein isoform X1 n=1 Tax=Pseudorasbora parva TaxID=51549 RepID=UPI00351EAACC